MKTFPWEVVILAAVLAANRLVVPLTWQRPAAFWGIQATNVGLAVATVVVGLPGLSGYPVVSWMVAALLAFHVFQNLALRTAALARNRRADNDRAHARTMRELEREP